MGGDVASLPAGGEWVMMFSDLRGSFVSFISLGARAVELKFLISEERMDGFYGKKRRVNVMQ